MRSQAERVFFGTGEYSFSGTVTPLTKVTVSLRKRRERVGGCKVGGCAAYMYCLEIALLENRTLGFKGPMEDPVGGVGRVRGNSISTRMYGIGLWRVLGSAY